MRISTYSVKSILITLALLLAAYSPAYADKKPAPANQTADSGYYDEEDSAKPKKAPGGEIYKPNGLGDIDYKKYRKNQTKVARPEAVKPAVNKPVLALPKLD